MNRVVYQYYTLKMRKRKGGNLQISSTMVFFPLYFIMDSGYTNEVSVYKLYLLGVNLSVIGRVLGQAFLRTTSPSRLRRATSPGRGGFGSPRKVNGFARGSPTRGAVERSETERLYRAAPFLYVSPGCGSQRLLRPLVRASHPAGRGPSFASLFPPLAAVGSAPA